MVENPGFLFFSGGLNPYPDNALTPLPYSPHVFRIRTGLKLGGCNIMRSDPDFFCDRISFLKEFDPDMLLTASPPHIFSDPVYN